MTPPKSLLLLLAIAAAGSLAIFAWKSACPRPPAANNVHTSRHTAIPAHDTLDAACANWPEKPDRTTTLQTLRQLQATLTSMPRDEARALIRAFLATGRDQPTGLSFEITTAGNLSEWPTFRTFLLDTLSAIDPAAAALLGREILTSPGSADEWALALRNIGRIDKSAEATAYLIEKTAALIANPAWQDHPSIGYLNAFDVLVHTHATAETRQSGADLAAHDRQVLAVIKSWTADPAFQPVAEHLRTMVSRLNSFVGTPQAPSPPAAHDPP